jgi:superfamily I DNA/RNA helicase
MPGVPEILACLRAPVLDAEPVPVADQVASAVESALELAETSALASSDDTATRVAVRAAADVLAPLAVRCGTDLDRFLDELSLGAEVDAWDPRADRVTLLTLHASKGLEFPVVFIVGCDDGLLPLRGWQGAETDYAEERRLLFVGMTRATAKLTLLTAARRTIRGETRDCVPSPFLASVDPALFDRQGGATPAKRAKRRDDHDQQFTLF